MKKKQLRTPQKEVEKKEEEVGAKEEREGKKQKVEVTEPQPILSQDEVDALIRSLRGGELVLEKKEKEGEVSEVDRYPRYDFRKVGRFISKMRLPSLEVIHRRFATDARSILSSALQKIIDVSMTDVTVGEFGNFIDNVPLPALFVVISLKPLRGFCLWVFEAPVVMAMIDILLGGEGRAIKAEGREFTRIEQRLVRKIVSTIIKSYQTAWEPITELKPEIVRIESHPQFVSIVPETDLVVYTRYDVDLGMVSGRMYIAIPYSILEPIKTQLQSAYQPTSLELDRKWVERLIMRLKECPVGARVELGRAKITLRELINFKKGDVIRLNTSPEEESAVVHVQNIPKYKGIPGKSGNSKAVFITRSIKTEDEMRDEILRKLI